MVLSFGVFLIQDSELRMRGDIQGKALSSGCCFQGILAFQLFQHVGREGQARLVNIRKQTGARTSTWHYSSNCKPDSSSLRNLKDQGLSTNVYDVNLLRTFHQILKTSKLILLCVCEHFKVQKNGAESTERAHIPPQLPSLRPVRFPLRTPCINVVHAPLMNQYQPTLTEIHSSPLEFTICVVHFKIYI